MTEKDLVFQQTDATGDDIVRVALVQAEPVWFDLNACVENAITYIAEAASKGAQLIAFPEVWIPGYPCWIWARGCDLELVKKYIQNSLNVDSPQMKKIQDAARENQIAVVLGFSDRVGDSVYLGQAYINREGIIEMRRQKIKPTHMERTVFGEGSGKSLLNVVNDPNVGKVGALCCWEHSQPLLKFHTHSLGEQIHIAAWPAMLPHEEGKGLWSTANEGALNLATTYAIEGGCFVLHTSAILTEKGVKAMKTEDGDQYYAPGGGGSCIIRPDGKIIAGRLASDYEGLLVADLDMTDILHSKAYLDTQGHYSRPDLLWLTADTKDKPRVHVHDL